MAKNRAKIGNRRYKQGKYLLQNPSKYIGHMPIVYRSSWEFSFCKFCDINDKVVKWSAESLEIPYQISKNGNVENHRYYPDFYVEMVNSLDPEKYDRVVIEIKPKHETNEPIKPKRQTLKMLENYEYSLKMYKQNLHKWAFTKDWCKRRNLKFVIITEDDLKAKGLIP